MSAATFLVYLFGGMGYHFFLKIIIDMSDDTIKQLKVNVLISLSTVPITMFTIYGGTALEMHNIIPEGSSFDIDAYIFLFGNFMSYLGPTINRLADTFNRDLEYIRDDENFKECDISKNIKYVFSRDEKRLFNNKLIIYHNGGHMDHYQIYVLINYKGVHNHILQITFTSDSTLCMPFVMTIYNTIVVLDIRKLFENNILGYNYYVARNNEKRTEANEDMIRKYDRRIKQIQEYLSRGRPEVPPALPPGTRPTSIHDFLARDPPAFIPVGYTADGSQAVVPAGGIPISYFPSGNASGGSKKRLRKKQKKLKKKTRSKK